MKKFKLSVPEYRQAKIADAEARFGFADMVEIEASVKRYADARYTHLKRRNQPDFNPLTDDRNCKTCGKKGKRLKDTAENDILKHGKTN
jgi:hypothetical protein